LISGAENVPIRIAEAIESALADLKPLWIVRGSDSSSDAGWFCVIVQAKDRNEAVLIAAGVFKSQGRADLISKDWSVEPLAVHGGLIFHTVQAH